MPQFAICYWKSPSWYVKLYFNGGEACGWELPLVLYQKKRELPLANFFDNFTLWLGFDSSDKDVRWRLNYV